ncbi:natural resistance-associated macrophage protein-domain-containing protein [Multifurca ochricompacta]|uniref:Natural resistance-associated macrophage protein-domain-containing protein n=1 Tax=Multifurca ochricompacta TaxID=376703 RepID=A0AAD4M0E3_9AGAM|nr:natural resistance-associated macrophage protein-domain-containing protein [Multifurca ochricompacta]
MSPVTSQPTSLDSMSDTRPTRTWAKEAWIHITKHLGVGVICSVAYFDPGNWGVDLQAGSDYGYKLLFVVLLAGLFAVFLQSLACKLGVVTGLNLASHCRLLFHNRSRHPALCRWLILYPLYVLSEVAIISTDLAELLGSAIALNLLFPKLPLWGGALLTAFDVLLILACSDPLHSRPVRSFEFLIGILVLIVLVCMCILVSKLQVEWGDAFKGFIPSGALFQHGGLYTSVGILGATVMPHSLFLGSALATQDRAFVKPVSLPVAPTRVVRPNSFREQLLKLFRPVHADTLDEFETHADRSNNSISFVKAHLHHAIVDIVVNLLGVAVVINALILILASSVFHETGVKVTNADIYDAYSVLVSVVGRGAGVIFALALLCCGQSASLVATVAGQIVSEGFIRWRVSPLVRRLVTRLLGLIPSVAVAVTIGRSGVNTMLVASQVVLSITLPFIIFPLVWLTSSRTVMRVRAPTPVVPVQKETDLAEVEKQDAPGDEYLDFSNSWVITVIGYAICALILAANCYVIITLILGEGN